VPLWSRICMHCILDEWRFLLVKGFRWKSLEKSVFKCRADSPGSRSGRTAGFWDLFNIWGFWQRFSRKFASRRTVRGQRRTVRYLPRNQRERCAVGVDRADGPRPARGQFAGPRRTVCEVLADSPPGPTGTSDSHWLRFFTVGIQTRTVHEGITDSPRGTHFSHNG
jgi:hypothetical protein